MKRFEGKIAFITGASRGIGKTVAKDFAKEGAKVCLLDINENDLEMTVSEFESKGYDVLGLTADVTDVKQVENSVNSAINAYGRIDILVNNAGLLRYNKLDEMDDNVWNMVIDVNLKGAFNYVRAVQKSMIKNRYGRIINLSSVSALGKSEQAHYSAAKAGLQGFTKTLANELGPFGITSNAVAPGFIETDMTREVAKAFGVPFDEYIQTNISSNPVKRSGKPQDISNAILFFSMEETSFINGQVLYVTGGPTI